MSSEAFALAALDGIDADALAEAALCAAMCELVAVHGEDTRRADRRASGGPGRGGRVLGLATAIAASFPRAIWPSRSGRNRLRRAMSIGAQSTQAPSSGKPHAVQSRSSRQDRRRTGCPLRRDGRIRVDGRRRDGPRHPLDRQLQGRARALRQVGDHPTLSHGARHRPRGRRRDAPAIPAFRPATR